MIRVLPGIVGVCIVLSNQPSQPDSHKILGVVIDAGSGQPLRRTLVLVAPIGSPAALTKTTMTNDDGTFEVTDLRPGKYSVTASKTGYLSRAFGQQHPEGPATPVVVSHETKPKHLTLKLRRGGVITGTIIDEYGDFVVGAVVRPLQSRTERGRSTLVPLTMRAVSNDVGEFRLFGLETDDYFLSAASRVGLAGGLASPSAPTSYYPGSPNPGDAQAIKVSAGETIGGISIVMMPSRAARLSGRAVTASGVPAASVFVNLVSRTGGPQHSLSTTQADSNGAFTFGAVPPGQYYLVGHNPSANDAATPKSAFASISVSEDDIDGIRLVMLPWAVLSGRVVAEPNLVASFNRSTARVELVRPGLGGPFDSLKRTAPVSNDGTFEISAPAGRQVLRAAALPEGWMLKGVRTRQGELPDFMVDLTSGTPLSGVELIVTSQGARLIGTVSTATGEPAQQFVTVVFPRDRERRFWYSGRVAVVRPNADGEYRSELLPPGDYFAAAIETMSIGQETDRSFLASLERIAVRVTLGESETKSLALTLAVR